MKKLIYLFLTVLIVACSDDEGNPCLYNPTLTTSAVTNITETAATLNGVISIVSQNCDDPNNTEQGFVYATTIQPTIANNKINVNGTDVTTTLENLEPNTTYYVRTFLTNALGEFYGNEVSFMTDVQGLNIGDLANGGIVFWINPNDTQHGLVCAPEDLSISQWGCEGLYINTETTIGSGLSNTINIVNSCDYENIAARICNDFNFNGYEDWYLPSKDELNLLYINLHLNGIGNFENGDGNCCNGWYWSSSDGELNGEAAWVQSFRDDQYGGTQATYDIGIKYFENHVRAIRSF
jgi:hypothetical protein